MTKKYLKPEVLKTGYRSELTQKRRVVLVVEEEKGKRTWRPS
jgi:hypothetical protein